MSLEPTGLCSALATFLAVWGGHVIVRAVEYRTRSLLPPAAALVVCGLALEAAALFESAKPLAAAEGIVGMTLLFDALELQRQFGRVREGRARANPANPRHRPYLAGGPAAPCAPPEPEPPRSKVER